MERPSFSVSSLSTDENQFRSFFGGGGNFLFIFGIDEEKTVRNFSMGRGELKVKFTKKNETKNSVALK